MNYDFDLRFKNRADRFVVNFFLCVLLVLGAFCPGSGLAVNGSLWQN